jgi:hypothetical protein
MTPLILAGLGFSAYHLYQWWVQPTPDGRRDNDRLIIVGLALFFMFVAPLLGFDGSSTADAR